MVEELLSELTRLGVVLVVDGGRLRYHPRGVVGRDMLERLREHKAEVLAIASTPWSDDHAEPAPCPVCGGLEAWESLWGEWRCSKCNPPKTAIRVLKKAEAIRRRHGLESSAGTVELLKSLVTLDEKSNI